MNMMYFGFLICIIGSIGMIASWTSGTPFFRCDGVFGQGSYASHICWNGSFMLSALIIGLSHGIGGMFIYFGYKDLQSPSQKNQEVM